MGKDVAWEDLFISRISSEWIIGTNSTSSLLTLMKLLGWEGVTWGGGGFLDELLSTSSLFLASLWEVFSKRALFLLLGLQ